MDLMGPTRIAGLGGSIFKIHMGSSSPGKV
jgi:hypothetical protein